MRRLLRNASLTTKLQLVVIVTSFVAVTFTGLALVAFDVISFRKQMAADVESLADVVAANSAAPLLFSDPKAGREALSALSARPEVLHATIYDGEGRPFVSYGDRIPGDRSIDSSAGGRSFDGGRLTLRRPVLLDGERIGTIGIVSDTRRLTARLQRYGLMSGIALAGSLLIAILLTSRLQRVVLYPILRLGIAVDTVRKGRDYSVRVPTSQDDELGLLTDAFNGMLEEIQLRDEQLQQAHDGLEQRVIERTRELEREMQERMQAEAALRDSEQQLRHSQKMEAVGRLAGGIAHDFNNLLTAILGYTELLLDRLGADHPLRGNAREIRKASERARNLTGQLLAFSRRQVLSPEVMDLGECVTQLEAMLARLIGETVQLTVECAEETCCVEADPGQIEQVLMNLVVNARDAMPTGGRIEVRVSRFRQEEGADPVHPDLRPGNYVQVDVCDSGSGIDDEHLPHIFEPFYTTKDSNKGTGLGLSTAYGIIRQSGGLMFVDSQSGYGTIFTFLLPRVDAPAPRSSEEVPVASGETGGNETILLVEDEEIVRDLAREILEIKGYRVLVAADGSDALRVHEQSDRPIDLMISDITMPNVSGPVLYSQLAPQRPGMKVIFMSGYTDEDLPDEGRGSHAFLQKPFTPDDLAFLVRRVLDGN